jgi:hypothetical protein
MSEEAGMGGCCLMERGKEGMSTHLLRQILLCMSLNVVYESKKGAWRRAFFLGYALFFYLATCFFLATGVFPSV